MFLKFVSKNVNKNLEISSVCSTLYLCNKIILYSIILLSMKRFPFVEAFHFSLTQSNFHLSSYRLIIEV